ncbi:flagellar hook-basal body protein [Siminovitchia fortis]|uniref:Flagellar hook-basal body protein n=1 Tax=Siminovitchia fortis TaxID=254758 RepID=A0A443IZE2_9BACI|nr:flagellar hook-basal body protein [Siminovitchia fortis]RWR13489.1 flagellar hook-basal body protein [Siminovitchia fortis]WHY81728.1 flagellar hook-basal body protein [Siminovitchia fortis]
MNRTMITAVNTLGQLQKQVDLIGHNMANAETAGYKTREASFADLMAQQINNYSSAGLETGRQSPLGIRQSPGARISQTAMLSKQGSLKTTGRPLDVAFTKENQYLKVRVQEGGVPQIRFTRNGELDIVNAGGQWMLATKDGHPVLDENNQVITFPGKVEEVQMVRPGLLEARMDNGGNIAFQLGVIALNKPQYMEQKGNTLIGLPDGADNNANQIYADLNGARRQEISLQQGVLEASNVDIGKEMTDLMSAQRSIQFQSRSITLADQMMGLINGIR